MESLFNVLQHFKITGTPIRVEPLGKGLINDTYQVYVEGNCAPQYVLQRINTKVFPDVEQLQRNIITVSSHICNKLIAQRETEISRKYIQLIETKDDKTFFSDGTDCWRLMVYIADSVNYQEVTPRLAYTAGLHFGQFEQMLSDITTPIPEIIPNFHNVSYRLELLKEAMQNDSQHRLQHVQYYIDAIFEREEEMSVFERLYQNHLIPKRLCHCDTKVNNMLFDKQGKFLCVIDLDTVMPSFIISDYGDFLRTAANTAVEDEPDLNKISFKKDIFEAFTRGFVEGTKDFITAIEKKYLHKGVKIFPYMQAVRFLTDYLNGDVYYKTDYPEHNLVRTKAQWRLLECVEKEEQYIGTFISKL